MPESLAVRIAADSSSITRVREVLDGFALRDRDGEILTAVRHFPARAAQWAPFPAWVQADLRAAYKAKGIERLYSHQAAAAEAAHEGKNIVIVTPTASGKTHMAMTAVTRVIHPKCTPGKFYIDRRPMLRPPASSSPSCARTSSRMSASCDSAATRRAARRATYHSITRSDSSVPI